MPCDPVERLCLAAKSGTIARVDEPQVVAILSCRDYLRGFEKHLMVWPGRKVLHRDFEGSFFDRSPQRPPAREPTIQHGRPMVAEPSKQLRQRVSPATGPCRSRKIRVQVSIHGARDMGALIVAASRQRLHKIKPAIHNSQAAAANLLQ